MRAALRWWLLKRVARSCGLKVSISARRRATDPLPSFVGLSVDDAATLEAMQTLAFAFRTDQAPRPDRRWHTEWTH
jgi:hypothetical protein